MLGGPAAVVVARQPRVPAARARPDVRGPRRDGARGRPTSRPACRIDALGARGRPGAARARRSSRCPRAATTARSPARCCGSTTTATASSTSRPSSSQVAGGAGDPEVAVEVRPARDGRRARWVHTFADAKPSELVLLVDSYGMCALALDRGSAAADAPAAGRERRDPRAGRRPDEEGHDDHDRDPAGPDPGGGAGPVRPPSRSVRTTQPHPTPCDAVPQRSGGTRQRPSVAPAPAQVCTAAAGSEKVASGRGCRRAWGGLGGFVEIGEPFSTPPTPTNRMPSSFPPGDALAPRIDGAPKSLS